MIILATHVTLNTQGRENFGPFHNIENYLKEINTPYETQKETLSTNPIKITTKIVKVIFKILNSKNPKVFIGFDPVNALAGIICKKIFLKDLKVIFYSIDYSKSRFGFFLLDYIYIGVDKFCAKYSDETWNCSHKVFELRNNYIKNKSFFVPNVPIFKNPNLKKFDKFTLVFTGYLNKIYRIDLLRFIIQTCSDLNINLYIIGDGEEKDSLEKLIKNLRVENNVFLKGYIKHNEVIDIIAQSHTGLAIYSGSESYDEYRDSMKIREFTFLELPTIATNKIPNSEEIIKYNLGKVVDSKEEIIYAIKFYLDNKNLESTKLNCKEYNKKFNIKDIYKERIFGTINP